MSDPRLHLLHLSSPALPVGAYAYSQGLEYAVEIEGIADESLREWIADGLHFGLARLELPLMRRAFLALEADDATELNRLNDTLLAFRETGELLLEDQQLGQALLRLLRSLAGSPGEKLDDTSFGTLESLEQTPGYAIAFCIAAHRWSVPLTDALAGFCYAWVENQVTAATKLVPRGQSAAQRLLLSLLEQIPEACELAAVISDDEIGMSLPGLAHASANHEFQHTRLFRS